MKNIFAIFTALAVFTLALVLAGCPNDEESSTSSNSDVIGTWKGSGDNGSMTLAIGDGTFTWGYGTYSETGKWERQGSVLTLSYYYGFDGGYYSFGTASLSKENLIVIITNARFPKGTYTLTKNNSSSVTTLKIKNESFTEITDVIWQGVSFVNNNEISIKTGTTVTKNTGQGSGYIFFKRKTNPIAVRTQELIVVEEGEVKEFTFTDNTLIVEVGNTGNIGTLATLNSTVVFFDDAEGEMQPYYESRHFVGYYKSKSDIASSVAQSTTNFFNLNEPKNGQKSIVVGGTNTALLHLRINLLKDAKLSFWYANKANGSDGTTFSINGVTQKTWTTDLNWAKLEYDLQPGENNIVWEKKDGYYTYLNYNNLIYFNYYYLSLDDILVYYTE